MASNKSNRDSPRSDRIRSGNAGSSNAESPRSKQTASSSTSSSRTPLVTRKQDRPIPLIDISTVSPIRKRSAGDDLSPRKSKRAKATASRLSLTASSADGQPISKGKKKEAAAATAPKAARIQPQVIDMTWLDDDEPIDYLLGDLDIKVKKEKVEPASREEQVDIPHDDRTPNESRKDDSVAEPRVKPTLEALEVDVTSKEPDVRKTPQLRPDLLSEPVPEPEPMSEPGPISEPGPTIWTTINKPSRDIRKEFCQIVEGDPGYVGSSKWQARVKGIAGRKRKSSLTRSWEAPAKIPFLRRNVRWVVAETFADRFPDLSVSKSGHVPVSSVPAAGGFQAFHDNWTAREAKPGTMRTDRYLVFQFDRVVPVDPEHLRPIGTATNALLPDEMNMRLKLSDSASDPFTEFNLSLSVHDMTFSSVTSRISIRLSTDMLSAIEAGEFRVQLEANLRRNGLPLNVDWSWISPENVLTDRDGTWLLPLAHFYLSSRAPFALRLDPPPRLTSGPAHRLRPLPRKLVPAASQGPGQTVRIHYDGMVSTQHDGWACPVCKDGIVYAGDGELALHYAVVHHDDCWIEEKAPREQKDGVNHIMLHLHKKHKSLPTPGSSQFQEDDVMPSWFDDDNIPPTMDAGPSVWYEGNTPLSTSWYRYTLTGLMEPNMEGRRNKWTEWSHRIEVGTLADIMHALDEVYTGGKYRNRLREHEELSPQKRLMICCWNRWVHEKGPPSPINNSDHFQGFIRAYADIMDRAELTSEVQDTLHLFFKQKYLSFRDYMACMTIWRNNSSVDKRVREQRLRTWQDEGGSGAVTEISMPAVVVPDVTVPPVTVPTAAVSKVTVPTVTVPSTTLSAVAVPAIKAQAVTAPSVAVPNTAVPVVAVPAVALPVSALPAASTPAASVPAASVTAASVPTASKPIAMMPTARKPATSIPAATAPKSAVLSARLPAANMSANSVPAAAAGGTSVNGHPSRGATTSASTVESIAPTSAAPKPDADVDRGAYVVIGAMTTKATTATTGNGAKANSTTDINSPQNPNIPTVPKISNIDDRVVPANPVNIIKPTDSIIGVNSDRPVRPVKPSMPVKSSSSIDGLGTANNVNSLDDDKPLRRPVKPYMPVKSSSSIDGLDTANNVNSLDDDKPLMRPVKPYMPVKPVSSVDSFNTANSMSSANGDKPVRPVKPSVGVNSLNSSNSANSALVNSRNPINPGNLVNSVGKLDSANGIYSAKFLDPALALHSDKPARPSKPSMGGTSASPVNLINPIVNVNKPGRGGTGKTTTADKGTDTDKVSKAVNAGQGQTTPTAKGTSTITYNSSIAVGAGQGTMSTTGTGPSATINNVSKAGSAGHIPMTAARQPSTAGRSVSSTMNVSSAKNSINSHSNRVNSASIAGGSGMEKTTTLGKRPNMNGANTGRAGNAGIGATETTSTISQIKRVSLNTDTDTAKNNISGNDNTTGRTVYNVNPVNIASLVGGVGPQRTTTVPKDANTIANSIGKAGMSGVSTTASAVPTARTANAKIGTNTTTNNVGTAAIGSARADELTRMMTATPSGRSYAVIDLTKNGSVGKAVGTVRADTPMRTTTTPTPTGRSVSSNANTIASGNNSNGQAVAGARPYTPARPMTPASTSTAKRVSSNNNTVLARNSSVSQAVGGARAYTPTRPSTPTATPTAKNVSGNNASNTAQTSSNGPAAGGTRADTPSRTTTTMATGKTVNNNTATNASKPNSNNSKNNLRNAVGAVGAVDAVGAVGAAGGARAAASASPIARAVTPKTATSMATGNRIDQTRPTGSSSPFNRPGTPNGIRIIRDGNNSSVFDNHTHERIARAAAEAVASIGSNPRPSLAPAQRASSSNLVNNLNSRESIAGTPAAAVTSIGLNRSPASTPSRNADNISANKLPQPQPQHQHQLPPRPSGSTPITGHPSLPDKPKLPPQPSGTSTTNRYHITGQAIGDRW
ncbi:hypothetical protein I317_00054 [Kwoniella heveanensis CBS 569]|nr:hypothetical protein I317_00054 [Kwoniella heveanensis CBS 569]